MLKKAGWQEGEGIGGRNIGMADPIPTPPQLKPRSGLGTNKRPPVKSKDKYKAKFHGMVIDGEVVYGTHDSETGLFHVHDLTTKGRPTPTTRKEYVSNTFQLRSLLWWKQGIVGIAESVFPHPTAWIVAGPDCSLDETTVKKLTFAFRHLMSATPSSLTKWESILGNINWNLVGLKYRTRLLTPRDYMTHFKLILHRALLTRTINSKSSTKLCRLCNKEPERITHLPNCSKLKPIWNTLTKLFGYTTLTGQDWDRLILLGLTPDDTTLKQAYSDLHLITWKFILIHFTLVDLKRQPFRHEQVWRGAITRYLSKANKLPYNLQIKQAMSEARSTKLSTHQEQQLLQPLGEIDDQLQIRWREDFQQLVDGSRCMLCEPG